MNIREMRQKRANLVVEARKILDRAETEKRALSQEENTQWDAMMADVDKIAEDVTREERLSSLETEMGQSVGTTAAMRDQIGDDDDDSLIQRQATAIAETRERPARPELRHILRQRRNPQMRTAFNRFLRSGLSILSDQERRDLQADSDTGGGFTRPDQQFVASLIKFVDDFVYVRQLATITMLDRADSIGIPVLDTDVADSDWTSELATGTDDTSMAFGRRELRPHPLAKRIKLSNKLMRQSAIDIEGLVRNRLGYKFGVTQEKAFLNGNGAQQPLGLFVASANGISTGRDVATDNTTTAVTADGLINAKYALKQQYWPRARWIFHRDTLKMIRKLKTTDGYYLWTDGMIGAAVSAGMPGMIVDIPYVLSEFAPNTFTTGKYVGILGDFSFYHIVDSLDFQIQRLVELYAEQNQVGFIGRLETDGAPTLEEAFVRVALA